MKVFVNGTERDLPDETSVATLVNAETTTADGVAVAVDRAVIPRSVWHDVSIAEGAEIEILHASQGG